MGQQGLFEREPVTETGSRRVHTTDDDEETYRSLMERAGLILAQRPQATRELRDKLGRKHPEVTERVVERLTELGLLDDEEFARRWVVERSSRKGSRALIHELVAKGIDRETAQATIDQVGIDEDAAALDLAVRAVGRVSSKPLAKQAAAIQGMLVRRGYSYEVAAEATRKVLPPAGWD